ncbi:MAG: DUF4375 domain-containing protein [Spirochaetales bacterium]|nr:DUF4375 domain-containing protein [Spirochaetales bacterium]
MNTPSNFERRVINGTIYRVINQEEVKGNPDLAWNAFIDLIALEDYESLSQIQKHAHLAFWYESEIQNGGHYQYFVNQGTQRLPTALEALRTLAAHEQATVLENAARTLHRLDTSPESVEDFIDASIKSNLAKFDAEYGACKKSMNFHLQKYLDQNYAHFLIEE